MARRALWLLCGLLAVLILLPSAHADAPESAGRWGVHGMALFGGREGLFVSHLPMFHAPHDVQVILQVHVADPAVDSALRQRLAGRLALWTVSPQRFDLDRLEPGHPDPLRRFTADMVEGHFERGGVTAHAGADVVVDKVLYFQRLVDRGRVLPLARYMPVGGGTERFLVKRIEARPDFDHIVSFTAPPNAEPIELTLPVSEMAAPVPTELQRAIEWAYGRDARLHGTVYFETGDLK